MKEKYVKTNLRIKQRRTNKMRSFGCLMMGMFLILLTLKLSGEITWSWWLVTAPLWGGIAIELILVAGLLVCVFGLVGFCLALAAIAGTIEIITNEPKKKRKWG